MTNGELESVLVHARALLDGADQLDWIRSDRAAAAEQALVNWTGPHADTFARSIAEEDETLIRHARDLRDEADGWAHVWADAVNQINAQRHEAAVDAVRSQRSLGEVFVDAFVGDDSADFVAPYTPVPAPSAATRYQATGGLRHYG